MTMKQMIQMMTFVCFCMAVQEGDDDDDDDDDYDDDDGGLCLFLYGYPGRQLR